MQGDQIVQKRTTNNDHYRAYTSEEAKESLRELLCNKNNVIFFPEENYVGKKHVT